MSSISNATTSLLAAIVPSAPVAGGARPEDLLVECLNLIDGHVRASGGPSYDSYAAAMAALPSLTPTDVNTLTQRDEVTSANELAGLLDTLIQPFSESSTIAQHLASGISLAPQSGFELLTLMGTVAGNELVFLLWACSGKVTRKASMLPLTKVHYVVEMNVQRQVASVTRLDLIGNMLSSLSGTSPNTPLPDKTRIQIIISQ